MENDEIGTDDKSILTISPSVFMMFIKCPLEYSYYHEKGLPQREFRKRIPGKWLSAAETGNFVHKIMERFYKPLAEENVNFPSDPESGRFEEVFGEVSEQMKELVPADSHSVQEREILKLHDKCHDYIAKNLEKLASKDYSYKPWKTEWDMPKDVKSIPIWNNSISIHPSGRIDRIDSYVDDDTHQRHIWIIDYKSGRIANDEKKRLSEIKEKSCQHVMYTKALNGIKIDDYELVVDGFSYEYLMQDTPVTIPFTAEDIKKESLFPEDMAERMVVEAVLNDDYKRRDKYRDENAAHLMLEAGTCRFCAYRDICMEQYEAVK